MMIAAPRGIRAVPSPRSTIRLTTGARMYAIRLANTNGRSTSRPRYRTSRTNSGKPHRDRNRRPGLSTPNHVVPRLRVGPEAVPVGTPLEGDSAGGSGGVIANPGARRP